MSKNCMRCCRHDRTGGDLLCDTCRAFRRAWIPVETELPDEGISVLVTQENGEVDPAYLDSGTWLFWGPQVLEVNSPVTHWMHFPYPADPSVSSAPSV